MNLNHTIIAGRLTRDPEHKKLPDGTDITTFSLATSSFRKDKTEDTEYHNIAVFGNQANACADFLKKGSLTLVVGRLRTRSWENDGVKHYRTEVIADRVQFGPRPGGSKTEGSTQVERGNKTPEYPDEDIKPEDIPF